MNIRNILMNKKVIGGTKCQEIAVKAASIHKNVN